VLISIKFTEKNCDSCIQFHKKILFDTILDERYLIDKYMNKYYNILCSLVWLAGATLLHAISVDIYLQKNYQRKKQRSFCIPM
jgi:hypothetical protein